MIMKFLKNNNGRLDNGNWRWFCLACLARYNLIERVKHIGKNTASFDFEYGLTNIMIMFFAEVVPLENNKRIFVLCIFFDFLVFL